jgi:hypothetical protein
MTANGGQLVDQQEVLGLLMRFASGDVRDHIGFRKNRPRTVVSTPESLAAVESIRNQLSFDFHRSQQYRCEAVIGQRW